MNSMDELLTWINQGSSRRLKNIFESGERLVIQLLQNLQQLSLTVNNGKTTYVAIYFHHGRIFNLVGKVLFDVFIEVFAIYHISTLAKNVFFM
ncbi:MAG: hypothetical protein WCS73_10530 [Lentisphaeria bacterium]